MPFGVCACAWGQFRRTMAAPFGVPGCGTLIPFRVQFFRGSGLTTHLCPTTNNSCNLYIHPLLSRFALLHMCIHNIHLCKDVCGVHIQPNANVCIRICIYTYVYIFVYTYICIYIGVNKSEVEIYVCIYGWLSKLGSLFGHPKS